LSQPPPRLRFIVFVISETFVSKGPSPGCKADVQEVPTVALEFSPGLLGLFVVWHCHDEALPLLPLGLDVFYELHPEALTELHSMMENSYFHRSSENGITIET
jgi:hypothetical protein